MTRRRPKAERAMTLLAVLLAFFPYGSHCTEENDLWLLVSSYEDVSITVKDLAFFLSTHDYNAYPEESYVTIMFSNGQEAYLTPNGASPRLADLWGTPPTPSGPVRLIQSDAIQKDLTYNKTDNVLFIKDVTRSVMFPLTPLGMCYDGSQKLAEIYKGLGYNVIYIYDPSQWYGEGHLWVLVEDTDQPDHWLAVDSYYGVVKDDNLYYIAPYSFADFEYLDSINPTWKFA